MLRTCSGLLPDIRTPPAWQDRLCLWNPGWVVQIYPASEFIAEMSRVLGGWRSTPVSRPCGAAMVGTDQGAQSACKPSQAFTSLLKGHKITA